MGFAQFARKQICERDKKDIFMIVLKTF